MKCLARHHWWIWALWIVWHIFAIRYMQLGEHILAVVLLIADAICIFPEALHFGYVVEHRQFTVKRLIYPDISFPCDAITVVEHANLFTAWGGRSKEINMNQIVEWTLGTYKITYSQNHRRKSILVCPYKREEFLNELRRNVPAEVICINNKESVFKKKKDR